MLISRSGGGQLINRGDNIHRIRVMLCAREIWFHHTLCQVCKMYTLSQQQRARTSNTFLVIDCSHVIIRRCHFSLFIAHPSCGGEHVRRRRRAPPFIYIWYSPSMGADFLSSCWARTLVPLCAGEDAEFALSLICADEYLLVLLNDPKLNTLAVCNYVCCFFKGTHYYIAVLNL